MSADKVTSDEVFVSRSPIKPGHVIITAKHTFATGGVTGASIVVPDDLLTVLIAKLRRVKS